MKIRYLGTRRREIAPAGVRPIVVAPGETFEVDAKTGRALLEQPRLFAAPPKRRKRAAKKAAKRTTGAGAAGVDRAATETSGGDEPSDSEE